MALKAVRVPAYGVKITNALKGKVVGRAYLYVMTNDRLRDLEARHRLEGSGV